MCFSATASFLAAATTGAIGFATLREVKQWREVPLAAMPVLFASQQAVEGALWLQLTGGRGDYAGALSLTFLLFAKVFWPGYAGVSVLLVEPDRRRRLALSVISLLGAALAIYLLPRILGHPQMAAICGSSIDYGGGDNPLSWQSLPYLLCACVPFLMSSHKPVQRFGTIVLSGFFVSASLYFATFVSVWCFFAAAGSAVLYFYFKHAGAGVRLQPG